MNLKTVMTRDTHEFKTINTAEEPRWMFDYLHRSGEEFADPIEEVGMEMVASSEVVPTVTVTTDSGKEFTVETPPVKTKQPKAYKIPDEVKLDTLEDIQAEYRRLTGKELPARYKNDSERLLKKINE